MIASRSSINSFPGRAAFLRRGLAWLRTAVQVREPVAVRRGNTGGAPVPALWTGNLPACLQPPTQALLPTRFFPPGTGIK